jgi:ribonucleoside-diphosphate reductase alpha chain
MSENPAASAAYPVRRLPRIGSGVTTRFVVGEQKGYLSTVTTDDGTLGRVTIRAAKQGSTLAGMTDALGEAITVGLQAGAAPDDYLIELVNTTFVPSGPTDDPEIPHATSMLDYVARRLAADHLPRQRRTELGIQAATTQRQEPGRS